MHSTQNIEQDQFADLSSPIWSCLTPSLPSLAFSVGGPLGWRNKLCSPGHVPLKQWFDEFACVCVCGGGDLLSDWFRNSDFWLLPLWGLLNHWVVFLATFVAANIEKYQTPNLMHRNRNPFFYLPPSHQVSKRLMTAHVHTDLSQCDKYFIKSLQFWENYFLQVWGKIRFSFGVFLKNFIFIDKISSTLIVTIYF